MDPVFLARIQFTLTICFHYIFPLITIGMSWLMLWMYYKAYRTKDTKWLSAADFWLRIFSVSFVVGVASGITMEFQFGTNWASYSRFVGDIFGAPLAVEVIFSFFLESIFISILFYGRKFLSPGKKFFSSFMVAFGASFSAFWITVANSWMQTPAGYTLANGRAELTGFFDAVFNPSTIPRFLHVMDGALITGAFLIMGLSAWYLIKGKHKEFALKSLRVSLFVALVTSLLQVPLGHYHAVQVAETQPEKLAAFEGVFDTMDGAPLLLFGIPNPEKAQTDYMIGIPGMLSFLVSGNFNSTVQGLKDFPRDEWPPLHLPFASFHLMVYLGFFFVFLTLWGLYLNYRNKIGENRLFLYVAFYSIPLPIIANHLGWVSAEVGRQPWIVWHLLKTSDAASPAVNSGHLIFSIIMFSAIYSVLFIAWILAVKRILVSGPSEIQTEIRKEEPE